MQLQMQDTPLNWQPRHHLIGQTHNERLSCRLFHAKFNFRDPLVIAMQLRVINFQKAYEGQHPIITA